MRMLGEEGKEGGSVQSRGKPTTLMLDSTNQL